MPKTTHLSKYLELTNSKRIKRTADEIERGLDAEGAAKERLATFEKIEKSGDKPIKPKKLAKRPQKHKLGDKGKFTIKCHPKADCDPDFLELLTGKAFHIELDQKWFAWFETKLEHPYEGNMQLLLEHILDMGIGEIIISLRSPEELAEHIRLTDFSTIKK